MGSLENTANFVNVNSETGINVHLHQTTDPFSRLNVVEPTTIFSSKQLRDNNPLLYAEKTTGSGSIVYTQAQSLSTLTVGSGEGYAGRQTRRRFDYKSGTTLEVQISGALTDGAQNIVSRMGYFDDIDGFFLERDGDDFYFVVRSYGSETRLPRSAWIDPLDGTGDSKINVDFTKDILISFRIEWLGVGQTQFCIHTASQEFPLIIAAVVAGNSTGIPYISTPNLPARYEIISTASNTATVNINSICTAVLVWGIVQKTGTLVGIISDSVSVSSFAMKPIMSIRLNPNNLRNFGAATIVEMLETMSIDAINLEIFITANQNLNAPVWEDVPYSPLQVDKSSTAITNFDDLKFISTLVERRASSSSSLQSYLGLGADMDNIPDVINICVTNLTNRSGTLYTALNVRIVQ